MAEAVGAPVLSTPVDDAFLQRSDVAEPHTSVLSTEQLDLQYEIRRTVQEIRDRKWKRIALQLPDDMLVDAPNVFDRLRTLLREAKAADRKTKLSGKSSPSPAPISASGEVEESTEIDVEERLSILGDTSYGACCVDEIAAEHVSADGIVHYGRSCLSPTQRYSVIYVYTTRSIDLGHALTSVKKTLPVKSQAICVMADVPWQQHVSVIAKRLEEEGYKSIIAPEIIHDPGSLLPNRSLPNTMQSNQDSLKEMEIWHIGKPPTALLLALASRVKQIHIYDPLHTQDASSTEPSTPIVLRRRYASLLKLSSAGVIGILINTLSVKNYLSALQYVQDSISAAGKKSYTFVVGKLNPPKLANFAEVDGWVVIGCWESSLIDSREFLAPVITPFELEVALAKDDSRVWGQEWISDFQTLLRRSELKAKHTETNLSTSAHDGVRDDTLEDDDDDNDDDAPPEFDLRTGRYISHSRPLRSHAVSSTNGHNPVATSSSALVQRAKGDLATVNGVASPGAEYLRSKRNWQGLGSDFDIEYDRDGAGNIQGATIEQGRSGVAKGYSHSQNERRS